jgi:DUF1680 family protein
MKKIKSNPNTAGTLNRRQFLRNSAVTATALGAHSLAPALYAATPAPALKPVLSTFAYSDVTFEPGLHDDQLHNTQDVLMALDLDALLKPFRVRSGQPAPGPDLGGWYDAYGFCPGHTFGQWLSALSRSYAITGDPATKARLTSMVLGFQQINDPQGQFFVDNRFCGYITEKLNCGFIDAYTYGQLPQAAEMLATLTTRALPYLPEKALSRAEQSARPHKDVSYTWDETYTLSENYFLAWQRTGDSRYYDLGVRFLYNGFFKPLAAGDNPLPGMHAYSHLNSLNSAAQAYLALNDPTYLKAATNGFELIRQQMFATGGWGPDEAFVVPGQGNLDKSLTKTHHSFETPCGSYGEFKLTRTLLTITADPRYGDEMERVMYNTILGAKPLQQDGHSFYYSDYSPTGTKFYHDDRWPCCSGTIAQIATDYRISTYLHDPQAIYVNLYLPSTVRWQHGPAAIQLQQQTTYPLDESVRFTVTASHPSRFALHLRIPAWAGDSARITVNGKAANVPVKPGTFATIDRTWHTHDRVELTLPLTLRLQPIEPETPQTVALMRGPLVLFVLGESQPMPEKLLLAAEHTAPTEWLIKTPTGDTQLRPFTSIQTQTYHTYTNLI